MAQPSARHAALAALRAWRTSRQLADSIIARILADSGLNTPDRAFALELFYGVLRNLSLLDFWIRQLRREKVDVDLRDILRLGLYQIFIALVPDHAAVNETVGLATQSHRGFINGMLRASIRQREPLQSAAVAQPLSVRTSHPEFLIERWQKKFGGEATAAICRWNNEPPRIFARINRLKIDINDFRESYPDAEPISATSNFFEFSNGLPNEALKAGHCYIQDPSTRLPCELLDPQRGERILDACAAPGGKTAYLAELASNQATIVACDKQPSRLKILQNNLNRLGVNNPRIVAHDWQSEAIPADIAQFAPFDRILIDTPCTNTGVIRRRVDVRWRLEPEEFGRMQAQQLAIACAVLPLLKKGGVLVYSTCSLEPEENQDVVRGLLEKLSILRLKEERDSLPFRDGFDGAYSAKLIKAG